MAESLNAYTELDAIQVLCRAVEYTRLKYTGAALHPLGSQYESWYLAGYNTLAAHISREFIK